MLRPTWWPRWSSAPTSRVYPQVGCARAALGDGRRDERCLAAIVVLAATLLVVAWITIYYVKPDSPREPGHHAVRQFLGKLRDGSVFEIPRV